MHGFARGVQAGCSDKASAACHPERVACFPFNLAEIGANSGRQHINQLPKRQTPQLSLQMPKPKTRIAFPPSLRLAALWLSWLAPATTLEAATIQPGDVTAMLGPSFFIDDAANGGNDADINQPSVPAYNRYFTNLLAPNQGQTKVVITGFGFAAHPDGPSNDATSVAVTFTYLGADEALNGGDDVVIGSASGTYNFTGGGEYVFAFDNPLSADLNITGTRFRIQIAPSNATNNGSLKLKRGSTTEPLLSVAGFAFNPQRLNLAKFQPVTATSANGQRLASYLTDGVVGNDNRWQGNSSAWQSAVIDFPFPIEVGSAQVFTGVDDANPIASYSVQFWNGSAWTSIDGASVTGNTNTERNLVFTNSVTASSFRFLSSETNLRVKELALYAPNGPSGYPLGTDLTLNLAYQRPVDATANTAGNFPLHAVDGRTNVKFWQTTTAGINTLDIDLRVSTKIGSVHLYSGSNGVSPLPAFTLKYWDGSAWQNITGGSVSGNTTADLVVSFTPVTTSQLRLEFTNPGTTSIRELQVFPANSGNTGYPLGTNIIYSGTVATYDTYHDAFYQITNPASGRFISVPANGQPALSQAGLTTAQGQYQVLLNLSNNTYRLRNRSTGNCLSGSQLSKTTGLLLSDEAYLALPHQDWILSPLSGGAFQFINAWSGLAIDTQGSSTAAGTALVQNTATGSTTQRWLISSSGKYPKKGVGGSNFAYPVEAKWNYNWGRNITSGILPEDASFYPMQWGNSSWDIGSNQGPLWQHYSDWRRRADGIHLLGFNEPDRTDQSNISLSTVITNWPRYHSMDLPLVSPAPGTPSWLNNFYTQADALGYRVDYTALHLYPGPSSGSSNGLISSLQSAYNDWNRPVWLTEFSFVDWNSDQSWSEEDNYQCLAEFLWRAEGLSWLRKYALFVFTEDANNPQPANTWQSFTPAPRSNSYDINGNLTPFGKLYAAWDNDASVRNNKTYHIHHKGYNKRIANLTTQSNLSSRNIRVDGQLVHWTLQTASVANRYYIVSSLDDRRLSTDGTNVSLVAAGTTGTAVEWTLTESQYGWYYIGHPATSKRLNLVYNNTSFVSTYSMVANTVTSDDAQWRFIVPAHPPVWSGAEGSSWTNHGSWIPDLPSSPSDVVTFNNLSVANLTTTLGQNFNINGILLQNPTGNVSIGGTHTLTLSTSGIDLSTATRNLTITAPVILSAAQTWDINTGRTLNVNGSISGAFPLTLSGAGTTSIGGVMDPLVTLSLSTGSTAKTSASNVLPTSNSHSIAGTLDLNGTSQTVSALTGSGTINNSAVGTAQLTVGNNNATVTLSPLIQNTGGNLSLIKTGTGALTLPSANTFAGSFTNNGTGNITPQHNNAFGSGPVVMNAGTIYPVLTLSILNPLTLNGGILRIGGGTGKYLTWTGAVNVTADSEISADGSTSGVTLSNTVTVSAATISSYANNGTTGNTITGAITGSGAIHVTGGTLNLNAANTFSGTLRSRLSTAPASILKIGDPLALQNATLDMNAADTGSVNLNNLNATLGALTGSRNLSLGSGAVSIGNNHASTTYSGILSGSGSLVKTGNGTLTLSGANSYSSGTTITSGTLALGASNSLPGSMTIGNATLNMGGFTETLSTLDVTGNAIINLGSGAALSFSNSNAIDWTGGTLHITGTFVSGSSIRFGTTSGGLTSTQLALITINGGSGPVTLNSSGFLVSNPYDAWSSQITNGQTARTQDADADGFTNIQEFLFGTSPIANNGALVSTTTSGNNLILRWLQRETAATYLLKQSTTLAAGSWTNVASPLPAPDSNQSGVPTNYDRYQVTLPTSAAKQFLRIEGTEN
jgi:autotransporter-associated beta strand protein